MFQLVIFVPEDN